MKQKESWRLKKIHTFSAGNEIPHQKGTCEQCDEMREFAKRNAEEQFGNSIDNNLWEILTKYCSNEDNIYSAQEEIKSLFQSELTRANFSKGPSSLSGSDFG